jgi:hypothetical protein
MLAQAFSVKKVIITDDRPPMAMAGISLCGGVKISHCALKGFHKKGTEHVLLRSSGAKSAS